MKAYVNGSLCGRQYVCVFMDLSRAGQSRFISGRKIIEADQESIKAVGMGLGGLSGMFILGRMVFRRFFKDNLEITKDRTETNIVVGQFERIRELESANKDLTALYVAKVAELGEVKGEVKALSMQCSSQAGQIKALEATIATMQGQINELMMRAR